MAILAHRNTLLRSWDIWRTINEDEKMFEDFIRMPTILDQFKRVSDMHWITVSDTTLHRLRLLNGEHYHAMIKIYLADKENFDAA